MRVLVAVASKHGATTEIGEEIRLVLRSRRIDVDLVACDDLRVVDGYDAAIIGSAVYAGHWRPEAKAFVERHAPTLEAIPVWLFSSGPLGDPPKPLEEPVEVAELKTMVYARGHALFAGRLDKESLNLGEKAMAKMVKAPYGDYRPWATIDAWAEHIADVLSSRTLARPMMGPDDGRLPSHTDHELRPD